MAKSQYGVGQNPNSKKNLVPFKVGNSGGPGRPRGITITDAYRKLLQTQVKPGEKDSNKAFDTVHMEMVNKGATIAEWIALAQIKQAMKGNVTHASEITDRIEGRARQQHHITGDGTMGVSRFDFSRVDSDRLRAMVRTVADAEVGKNGSSPDHNGNGSNGTNGSS